MATTVFPVTDQTATKALWDAMASAIDRGETDPVSSISGTEDTDRLQYYGTDNAGGTDSDVDFHEIASLNVDLGQVFYFEAFLAIDEVNSAAPIAGDSMNFRVRLTSGLNLRLVYWQVQDPQTNPGNIAVFLTEQTSTSVSRGMFTRSNADVVAGDPMVLSGLLFGDTASGTMSIDIVKAADTTSNEFEPSPAITIVGRRIW